MSSSWFEQLEARLEQQLEAFLRSNPAQQALLQDLEQQDQRQRRQRLVQQAEQLRSELLELAAGIQQWQARVDRARRAGAQELAARAEAHCSALMERGRQRWQRLEQLGLEVQTLNEPPPQAPGRSHDHAHSTDNDDKLEQAWSRFEADQALEELRRRQAGR